MRHIEVGYRVAYSAAFLRNTGQFTGDMPFERGTVRAIELDDHNCRIVNIRWDNGSMGLANTRNLVREDDIAIDAVKN